MNITVALVLISGIGIGLWLLVSISKSQGRTKSERDAFKKTAEVLKRNAEIDCTPDLDTSDLFDKLRNDND